jgi:hypothetical protein
VNPLHEWILVNHDAFEMVLSFCEAFIGSPSDEEVVGEFIRELEESDVQGIIEGGK